MKQDAQRATSAAAIVLALVLLAGHALAAGAALRWSNATPPVGTSAVAPGSLASMLSRLPDFPLGNDGGMVTFADLALQAAAVGVDPPRGIDDEVGQKAWVAALTQLFFPETAAHWGRAEWREVFGFDLFQVDQAVEYNAPPLSVTVVRGRFDADGLHSAWTRGGYQPIDLGAGEAYAVREDFAVDIDDPGGRMALARMNVVALTDDGTLIFGSSRDAVRAALAAAAGEGPSFAARPEIARLLQAVAADLVTAVLVPGDWLQAVNDPTELAFVNEETAALATQIAAETTEARRLPAVAAALLGHTAGMLASEDATASAASSLTPTRGVAVLALRGAGTAENAASVIQDRLATQEFPTLNGGMYAGHPWAEIFPQRSVEAVPAANAVRIELTPATDVGPNLLQQMVFNRTPGFLGWSP